MARRNKAEILRLREAGGIRRADPDGDMGMPWVARPAVPDPGGKDGPSDVYVKLADEVLATNAVAADYAAGILAVPDVIVAEGVANGNAAPASWRLNRADGRSVTFYRIPRTRTP
jgi:hypothetical protein